MKVYYAAGRKDHTALVTPAADPRAIKAGVASDWLTESGEPRSFTVDFRHGVAEVTDELGRYLVAVGLAKRTALLLPRGVAA